ncbi:MAG TPA: EF-hand domain-containing protein [Chthoniobacter sp.]|nr:EF-hand domain-containing protein [Chthoniobacter sp.]
MKSITSVLALLAVGTTLALADDKPAAPPAGDGKPATTAPAAPAAGDAAKPKRDPAEVFKKLDTNGDGKISLDEFKAGPQGKKDPAKAEEIFKKKDKDGDGFLSLEEFSAHGEKKAK